LAVDLQLLHDRAALGAPGATLAQQDVAPGQCQAHEAAGRQRALERRARSALELCAVQVQVVGGPEGEERARGGLRAVQRRGVGVVHVPAEGVAAARAPQGALKALGGALRPLKRGHVVEGQVIRGRAIGADGRAGWVREARIRYVGAVRQVDEDDEVRRRVGVPSLRHCNPGRSKPRRGPQLLQQPRKGGVQIKAEASTPPKSDSLDRLPDAPKPLQAGLGRPPRRI